MADVIIDLLAPEDLSTVVQLYNQIFRPPRDEEHFQRRYLSREWNNIEESSAVTDAGIFQQFPDGTYLVKPAFAQSVEIVRGKKIKFRLFRRTRYLWFWKRTYERLAGWENKQSSHYVYEFVARR